MRGEEHLVDALQMDAKRSPVQVEHRVACQEGMKEHRQQHEHCQPGKERKIMRTKTNIRLW